MRTFLEEAPMRSNFTAGIMAGAVFCIMMTMMHATPAVLVSHRAGTDGFGL
jgi:hypothetical protein